MICYIFSFNIQLIVNLCVAQSALTGGIVGVIAMSVVSLNAQWAIAAGRLKFEHKPMSVEQCSYDFDRSIMSSANDTLLLPTEYLPQLHTQLKSFLKISLIFYDRQFQRCLSVISNLIHVVHMLWCRCYDFSRSV